MLRTMAIGAFAAGVLACFPALTQAEAQELEGAPGWLAAQQAKQAEPPKKAEPATKPAPRVAAKPKQQAQKQTQLSTTLKADQAKLAKQAEVLKAERERLDQMAADLKAREESLDARAAQMAEERLGSVQARIDASASASRQAGVTARDEDAPAEDLPDDFKTESPVLSPAPRRPAYAGLDVVTAERSCQSVAEDRALARDFYSARYTFQPRLYQSDGWELRGRMRLDDRRGYLLIDTVCEIGPDSQARDIIFLR